MNHTTKVALDRADRERVLAGLREYLRAERGEDIGDLAALLLHDFIASDIAPYFYNAGIASAQQALHRAGDATEAELDAARLTPPVRERAPRAGS